MMNTTTHTRYIPQDSFTPHTDAAGATMRGLLPAARQWIDKLLLDRRERYLAAATDHADCEWRLRAWDAHEQGALRRLHGG